MLVDTLLETTARAPQSPAVSDGLRRLTYAQLELFSRAMRSTVLQHTTCERVGVMLPASTAFPAVLMGVLWASKVAIPLNFLLSPKELAAVVKDAGFDLVVTVGHFRGLVEELPVRCLYLDELPIKRKLLWAKLRRRPPVPTVRGDQTAVILYTSGTTAEPKGVELSYNNLYSNCVDTIATLEVDPQQRFLNVLPPFHVFGLTANVLLPIVLGASVHSIPRFNPPAVIRTIVKERPTIMMAVPSMYAAMLRAKSAKADTFKSLYLVISGGEPLHDRVREEYLERFGVHLHEGYGLTETSPVVAVNTATAHRVGTVGRTIRHVEVRLIDEKGDVASADGDGEIQVRGPGVMKGYYGRPDQTQQVIDSQGWFSTGDIGHLDSDGFLSITGRAKEMLIIGGENVFPQEIESVLARHEGVLQAAVVGTPDELRGEVPLAFVIPRSDALVTESELREFAKRTLAGFKVPKRIVIRDDLPTGATGKILKRQLRDLPER